jgi:cytoskeletal protein RodZ
MNGPRDSGLQRDAGHAQGTTPPTPQSGPSLPDGSEQVRIRDLLSNGEDGFYPLVYSPVGPDRLGGAAALRDEALGSELRRVAQGLRLAPQPGHGCVLLVGDDQPTAQARAFVAAQIARLLAGAQHRVLLVDADFRQGHLSAALGQEDHVGLIDMARYGASLRSSTQDVGIQGVGLVGVGSFWPDEGDPCSDDELRHALAQLRAFAAFVLLVAPTRLADGTYNPLFAYVDGVLLAVTLRDPSEELLEPTVRYLRGLSIPLQGVVAFTRPARPAPPAASPDLTPGAARAQAPRSAFGATLASAEAFADADDRSAGKAPLQAEPRAHPRAAAVDAAADTAADAAPGDAGHATPPFRPRSGAHAELGEPASEGPVSSDGHPAPARKPAASSPFFRVLTLAMAMLLLSFVGWWMLVERGGHRTAGTQPSATRVVGPQAPAAGGETASPPPGAEAQAQGSEGEAAGPEVAGPASRAHDAEEAFPEEEIPKPPAGTPASAKGADAAPGGAGAAAAPASPAPAASSANSAPATPSGPSTATGAAASSISSAAQTAADGSAAASRAPNGPASTLSEAERSVLEQLLKLAPGQGYALHLWSFPDSMEAVAASVKLANEGMQPAVRSALVSGRRWFRVLVGEYPTRKQATAARVLLAQRRDVDFVGVVRIE